MDDAQGKAEAEVKSIGNISAKVIRANGTVEELGVIGEVCGTDQDVKDIQRRVSEQFRLDGTYKGKVI